MKKAILDSAMIYGSPATLKRLLNNGLCEARPSIKRITPGKVLPRARGSYDDDAAEICCYCLAELDNDVIGVQYFLISPSFLIIKRIILRPNASRASVRRWRFRHVPKRFDSSHNFLRRLKLLRPGLVLMLWMELFNTTRNYGS